MATILLIHGAYQGGWIWTRVAARLRAAGHLVLAPSLDGCAERAHALRPGITTETHAAEMAGLLFHEDLRDVVLVGTSTGGMVMARTAELVPERIGRVVFADALALFDGEALPDIVQRKNFVRTDLATGPTPEDMQGRLFADLDPETKAWTIARCTLHPVACMEAKVVLPRFWSMPWKASVIWCRQSANPPVAHQRRAAETLKASWHELDTGHYPMLTEAERLTALIERG